MLCFIIVVKTPVAHPFHSNIIMHILCAVLYTFHKVLTGRICLTIKSFFGW